MAVVVPAKSLAVLPLVFLSLTASADPRDYIGVADQAYGLGLGQVSLKCGELPLLPVGSVCFPGGHIVPAMGTATIAIFDSTFSPNVSAFYCQDSDDDGLCGEGSEFSERFCLSLMLMDAAAGVPDPNWDSSQTTRFYVDGPVAGSPLINPCGGNILPTFGTTGYIDHT